MVGREKKSLMLKMSADDGILPTHRLYSEAGLGEKAGPLRAVSSSHVREALPWVAPTGLMDFDLLIVVFEVACKAFFHRWIMLAVRAGAFGRQFCCTLNFAFHAFTRTAALCGMRGRDSMQRQTRIYRGTRKHAQEHVEHVSPP